MLELQNVTIRMRTQERTLVDGFSFTLGRGDRAVAVLLDRGFSKALEERLRGAG